MSNYADPATTTGVDLKALNGSLLLVTVKQVRESVATSFGVTDAVACDIAVLDGEQKGETYSDALLFPKILVSSLRPHVGYKVLARLGQGTAKAGQSAPWVLAPSTAADKETAAKYEAHVAAQSTVDIDSPF